MSKEKIIREKLGILCKGREYSTHSIHDEQFDFIMERIKKNDTPHLIVDDILLEWLDKSVAIPDAETVLKVNTEVEGKP